MRDREIFKRLRAITDREEWLMSRRPGKNHDLLDHLVTCGNVKGAIVGDEGVDMTPVVVELLAQGWEWGGQETIGGKRVRYLRAPK